MIENLDRGRIVFIKDAELEFLIRLRGRRGFRVIWIEAVRFGPHADVFVGPGALARGENAQHGFGGDIIRLMQYDLGQIRTGFGQRGRFESPGHVATRSTFREEVVDRIGQESSGYETSKRISKLSHV